MKDLGGPLSRDDIDARLDRYRTVWGRDGYGRWLVETSSGMFLGYCGVMARLRASCLDTPGSPGT
jgi:hypothetical protein